MRSLKEIAADLDDKAKVGMVGIVTTQEAKVVARILTLLPTLERYALRICHDAGNPMDRENAMAVVRLIRGVADLPLASEQREVK